MKDLILIGGGGHCKSCIDVIETTGEFQIRGIIEKNIDPCSHVLNYPIIGCDDNIPSFINNDTWFLITVGQIGAPTIRLKIYNILKNLNANIATVISPLAHVSRYSEIGTGSIIMHQAIVNAGAKVGVNCIINTKALIEHDVVVNDHCHIATAAVINGNVEIGKFSFIGSSAVTKHGIFIPENAFIKANSTVK